MEGYLLQEQQYKDKQQNKQKNKQQTNRKGTKKQNQILTFESVRQLEAHYSVEREGHMAGQDTERHIVGFVPF